MHLSSTRQQYSARASHSVVNAVYKGYGFQAQAQAQARLLNSQKTQTEPRSSRAPAEVSLPRDNSPAFLRLRCSPFLCRSLRVYNQNMLCLVFFCPSFPLLACVKNDSYVAILKYNYKEIKAMSVRKVAIVVFSWSVVVD